MKFRIQGADANGAVQGFFGNIIATISNSLVI